jgi:hypothetical protein
MTLLIDVGTVLRATVCDLYSNLVTRPTGAAVRTAIEQQVLEIGSPVVTTIDFSQVGLLDFSCADEIVAKLLLRYSRVDGPINGYLLFRGIRESHLDPIETVLERHGLALVAWLDSGATLLGSVTSDERDCWQVVYETGPVWTETVAGTLNVPLATATERLHHLARRRLLMQREDGFAVPGLIGRGT